MTDSRTVPAGPTAWLSPPDPPGDLAPVAPARRFAVAIDHAPADLRSSATLPGGFAPTPARASTTKARLSMHGSDMLAPMGCDPGAARPGWDGRGRSRRRLWGCESNAPRGRCRGSSAGRAAEHLLRRPEGRGRALLRHQEHRIDRPVAPSMVTIRSSASWPSSQPWREPS